MFGKPEWFRPRERGWGLVPASWQGWAYAGAWSSVLVLPATALLVNAGWLETLIWLAASGGLLAWDLRQIREGATSPSPAAATAAASAVTQPAAAVGGDVLYIGDDDGDRLATQKFDMRLRR